MDVLTYKCPRCDAPLEFGIESQSWVCKFCGNEYAREQIEKTDYKARMGEGYNESRRQGFGNGAAAYECPSCGGRIMTDATTAATFCVYCNNPAIIASRLANDRKPDYILPFKKNKDEAAAAVKKLCKYKPLLPKKFKESVQKGEVSGLYVPFWLFSGEISARLEGKGRNVTTWRDNRFIYTRTDTYAVLREADISLSNIPADGSSRMDDTLMESLEPFDYNELKPFSMEYISGHYADAYDVDPSQAEDRVLPRIKEGAEGLMREQTGRYASFSTDRLEVESRGIKHKYALMPVWTLMHKFGGKTYYFAMNGQTGKMTGRLPVSWPRFFTIMASVWAAAFGINMILRALNL